MNTKTLAVIGAVIIVSTLQASALGKTFDGIRAWRERIISVDKEADQIQGGMPKDRPRVDGRDGGTNSGGRAPSPSPAPSPRQDKPVDARGKGN